MEVERHVGQVIDFCQCAGVYGELRKRCIWPRHDGDGCLQFGEPLPEVHFTIEHELPTGDHKLAGCQAFENFRPATCADAGTHHPTGKSTFAQRNDYVFAPAIAQD